MAQNGDAPRPGRPKFPQKKKPMRPATPMPCPLCYHPLDAWGCCEACERRAGG